MATQKSYAFAVAMMLCLESPLQVKLKELRRHGALDADSVRDALKSALRQTGALDEDTIQQVSEATNVDGIASKIEQFTSIGLILAGAFASFMSYDGGSCPSLAEQPILLKAVLDTNLPDAPLR